MKGAVPYPTRAVSLDADHYPAISPVALHPEKYFIAHDLFISCHSAAVRPSADQPLAHAAPRIEPSRKSPQKNPIRFFLAGCNADSAK